MKLPMACMKCFQETEKTPEISQYVELQDSGVYVQTCSQGHTSKTILQNPKYEVLFESGIYALIDGYPREAVTSFVAGFERFWEFYISFQASRDSSQGEEFKNVWKEMANQSERQLGAFLIMHLANEKKCPEFNFQNYSNFRNKVVHKGYIPTMAEAIGFGETIRQFVTTLMMNIKSNYDESLQKFTGKYVGELHKLAGGESGISTMYVPTLLSHVSVENQKQTLEQYAEEHKIYSILRNPGR
jgi:hypothetical protein